MKLSFSQPIAALALTLACAHQTAFADVPTGDDSNNTSNWSIALGGGMYAALNPYIGASDDQETGVLPWFSVSNDWVSIDPTEIALTAYASERISLEALVAPRWQVIDPADVVGLDGMERSMGVDIGARISAQRGSFVAAFAYKTDVSNNSEGDEVDASVGVQFELSPRLNLGIEGGVYWRDQALSNYLYGVSASESRSDRPAYDVGSTTIPYIGLQMTYFLTEQLSAVFAVQGESFDKKITDSPIIDRELSAASFIALLYTF